ncbi:hypothetical protein BOTU111921_24155 [Bordetella tumbae]|uniref:SGNH/GDSL hydrolase family protein n=1 Tax=Bordetella tumbae TaxID=1649139 RepID=UPI0039EF1B41
MKFLFVGGSNTLMREGYVRHFKFFLEQFCHEEIEIRNIAIGANSCVHGLELIKAEQNLSDYDCVVIEYVINDYQLAKSETIHTWRQAYDGLIRHLIKNCAPHTRIINLVLGRRSLSTFAWQNRLTREINALVKKYSSYASIEIINITRLLMAICDKKRDVYENLYKDYVHYKPPVVASLVGSLLSNHYISGLVNPKSIDYSPLPENYQDNFENSVVVDASRYSIRKREFKNSHVDLTAASLSLGETVEIELSGTLVAFTYVSTFDSLSVLVEEEGEAPFVIDCQHKWVKGDENRFMSKNFPLSWKNWSNKGGRKVRFTAITGLDRDSLMARYVNQYNIHGPSTQPLSEACFYLAGLLVNTSDKIVA